MKRFFLILLSLVLLCTAMPLAAGAEVSSNVYDPTIDTVPAVYTGGSIDLLGRYYYQSFTKKLLFSFTALESGKYCFYERRKDKYAPKISLYSQFDEYISGRTGTANNALVFSAYLKEGTQYKILFTDTTIDDWISFSDSNFFFAACSPSRHVELGPWETMLKSVNGDPGKKARHCDFCKEEVESVVIPAVPYNVKTRKVTSTTVSLDWGKAENATKYEIAVREGSLNAKRKVIGTTTRTNYIATKLKTGIPYYFQVRAITKDGTSAYTSNVRVKPVPSKPSGFTVKSTRKGKVTVKWEKVDKTDGYYLYRSESPTGKFKKIKDIEGGKTERVTLTQSSRKTYYYKLIPYRKVGGKPISGKESNTKSVKVQ